MRRVWEAFQNEQATGEDVLGVLHQVAGFVQFEQSTLADQVQKGISQPEDPIFRRISAAFAKHLRAVELCLSEFELEQLTGERYAEGLALAQEANNELMAAHQTGMEHIEAMANVDCIFCHHVNPRGEERCANCGRNLPGALEKSSFAAENVEGLERGGPQGSEVTENYIYVHQALHAWREEAIDADELLGAIEEVEKRTRAHQADILYQRDQISLAPPESQAALHHGVDLTQAGLRETLAALEKMKMAFQKEDDTYLETGLFDLERASRGLVEAFHAAREAAAAIR